MCGAWNESFYGECNGQVGIMKFNHFSSSEDFAVVWTKTVETELRGGKISKWNTRDNH